jgi:probable phosphoglycerate mutase
MELLLIRHALPVRRELEDGVADPELSPEGLQQAQHLARYLDSEHLDAVYASSLQRAHQTAEAIVERRDVSIVTEPDVAEWDRHSPEYVPVEELKATNDPRWQAMLDGTFQIDDEDPTEFNKRTVDAIERIIDEHRGHRVAVACHGGVINAYLSHLLGLESDSRGFFYPNYTSIHRIAAASTGERSVVTINETSHLRGTGLPMGLFQRG